MKAIPNAVIPPQMYRTSARMKFIYKKVGQTYVVWLEEANRFMQLQEPAFFVFKAWAKEADVRPITWQLACNYELDEHTSQVFVSELLARFDALINPSAPIVVDETLQRIIQEKPNSEKHFSNYQIRGKNYRFTYASQKLKCLLHSGLSYTECFSSELKIDHSFEFFEQDELFGLEVDASENRHNWVTTPERLIGLLNQQLLNCMYDTCDDFWLGAVHASAASAGSGAVLFTAPSGSGKSTFAAVLKHLGYQILADDFAPISVSNPEIYPFPEGISVKARSVEFLADYFPELKSAVDTLTEGEEEILPVSENTRPMPVKAIVFLRYDPSVDLIFKKRNNLEAMDDLLKQLWLPARKEVAQSFLNWFFVIPCYTLRYSNTQKAIECVESLLRK